MDEFDFSKWAEDAGLSKDTIQLLTTEELCTFNAMEAFYGSFNEEARALNMKIGQKLLLRKALLKLFGPKVSAKVEHEDPSPPVTTKDLSSNKELNAVLEALARESGSYGVSDLFGIGDSQDKTQSRAGTSSCSSQKGKPLFIRDFISCNRYLPDDTNDTELLSGNGNSLVLKSSSSQKPRPEAVNMAQWISANARIMKQLFAFKNEDNGNFKDLLSYLEYTEQIGEYLQIYQTPNVMLYDHKFREKQSKGEVNWGTPDIHAVSFYMSPHARSLRGYPSQGSSAGSTNNNRPGQSNKAKPTVTGDSGFTSVFRDANGIPICRDYQTDAGCSRRVCRFSHVCIAPGCRKSHPQCMHQALSQNKPSPNPE